MGDIPQKGGGIVQELVSKGCGGKGFLTRPPGHSPWHREPQGSLDHQQDPRDPGGSKGIGTEVNAILGRISADPRESHPTRLTFLPTSPVFF